MHFKMINAFKKYVECILLYSVKILKQKYFLITIYNIMNVINIFN